MSMAKAEWEKTRQMRLDAYARGVHSIMLLLESQARALYADGLSEAATSLVNAILVLETALAELRASPEGVPSNRSQP
jgi:hypothetical protein